MWGSATVYAGLTLALLGLVTVARSIWQRRVWRSRGLAGAVAGASLAGIGLYLPAHESRVARPDSRLDEFAPVWQFREVHSLRVAAPPARVFEAMRRVRADEILLFRTLTWIRRGGRRVPASILNASDREPLIDIATKSGFVRLADDPPRELVIGAMVVAPPGTGGTVSPRIFRERLPPGFARAAMNFVVTADGSRGSIVSTETRVYASDAAARRRFAVYWRVIYPGSAIIRRMWLRAIARRATDREADAPPASRRQPARSSTTAPLQLLLDDLEVAPGRRLDQAQRALGAADGHAVPASHREARLAVEGHEHLAR